MKQTERSLITWGKKIDLTHELYRVYEWPGGDKVRIERPLYLIVSDNGHRVVDSNYIAHYIPYGWIHLWWENDDKTEYQFNHQRTGKQDG
jgi:hypothetical protein